MGSSRAAFWPPSAAVMAQSPWEAHGKQPRGILAANEPGEQLAGVGAAALAASGSKSGRTRKAAGSSGPGVVVE